MANDPIAEFIRDFPSEATILTGPIASPGYSPDTVTTPAPPDSTPVLCFFRTTKNVGTGGPVQVQATIYLNVDDLPAHARPNKSRVEVGGATYVLTAIRQRRWEGVINGWELSLGA